jgi:hypothetical protein
MIDEVSPADWLPLVFTTALVVYALAMGSADLARTVIRVSALVCASFCLTVWGVAALSSAFWGTSWGEPVIADFYATALLAQLLGMTGTAAVLFLLAVAMLTLARRDLRRRRVTLLNESGIGGDGV